MRQRKKVVKRESRKPQDLAFKQQRLVAWQPLMTPKTMLPWFFILAFIMIPIGAGVLVFQNDLKSITIDYTYCANADGEFCSDIVFPGSIGTSCTCSLPFTLDEDYNDQVFIYYRLENYVQNHRRYVRSRDDFQMHGHNDKPNSDASPLDTLGGVAFAPCGFIANSMFNDTISVLNNGNPVPLSAENIAWNSDFDTKFQGGLANVFNNTLKPPNWNHTVWSFPIGDTPGLVQGFRNPDFINWMRVGALKRFSKLYRKVLGVSLPRGAYTLEIRYNYPVIMFDGRKKVVIATMNRMGGKNKFIGISYIVCGSLSLVSGIAILARQMIKPRQLGDNKYMLWNK